MNAILRDIPSDPLSVQNKHYKVLALAVGFYLVAQTVQFILHWTILPHDIPLGEEIVTGQHPLNYVRLALVLASMFIMVPGYLILALNFYREQPLRSLVAATFFLFFCLFEMTYRSIELFQAVSTWGSAYASADPCMRAELFPKFQEFYSLVEVVYFPLLVSLLIGSACLCFAAIERRGHRLLALAMGIQALQQLARLASYVGVKSLNPMLAKTYFPAVVIVFGALLLWTLQQLRSTSAPPSR